MLTRQNQVLARIVPRIWPSEDWKSKWNRLVNSQANSQANKLLALHDDDSKMPGRVGLAPTGRAIPVDKYSICHFAGEWKGEP